MGQNVTASIGLPAARGPLSAWVVDLLGGPADRDVPAPPPVANDGLSGDDLHLALYLAYEVHYRSIDGVDDRWEWHPSLLAFRASLERSFESALHDAVATMPGVPPGPIDERLRDVLRSDAGPSLSIYLQRAGTIDQSREFLMHRSAYQLKEADPHAWAIPRLPGRAKVALVEIEADEYGGGDASWMHSELFRRAMVALELDATVGAYVERLPGTTLATVNVMSLFGLHRRWLGAIVGHLAAFEMTSCIPNRRYGNGLRRLGLGEEACAYFDEHVEADAVHEVIAANELAGSLVAAEPDLEDDVLFGARALCALEARFADRLLGAWSQGRSSLHEPLVAAAWS